MQPRRSCRPVRSSGRAAERAFEGGSDGLAFWSDGETRGTFKDKGSGAVGVGHLGLIRRARTIASDSNFSHVRVKGKNHLDGPNLGCLASWEMSGRLVIVVKSLRHAHREEAQ